VSPHYALTGQGADTLPLAAAGFKARKFRGIAAHSRQISTMQILKQTHSHRCWELAFASSTSALIPFSEDGFPFSGRTRPPHYPSFNQSFSPDPVVFVPRFEFCHYQIHLSFFLPKCHAPRTESLPSAHSR